VVGPVCQPNAIKRRAGAFVPVAAIARVQERQFHIGDCGGAWKQVVGLEHEPELTVAYRSEFIVIQARDILAVEQVGAAGGLVQAPECVHQSGLARAGRPHDADVFAFLHHEVDAAEDRHQDLAGAVGLLDSPQFDHRHRLSAVRLLGRHPCASCAACSPVSRRRASSRLARLYHRGHPCRPWTQAPVGPLP